MMLKQQKRATKPAENSKKLLIVGLGNPGEQYRETRHNAGFAVIDFLSQRFNISLRKIFLKPVEIGKIQKQDAEIFLVKPMTYMNRSGDILEYVMKKTGTNLKDFVLVCDNMDLKPGVIRLKKKGSSAGHNGIKSVIDRLETPEFARLYIGVGRSLNGESVVEHVLGCFSPEEQKLFSYSVQEAAEALLSLSGKSVIQVMNEINKKNS